MRVKYQSILFKVLVFSLVLGLVPAALVVGRVILLNRQLLERGSASWILPEGLSGSITRLLFTQAALYLILAFLILGLSAAFIMRREINVVHNIQQILDQYHKENTDLEADHPVGDEIEDLAVAFISLSHKFNQLKLDLASISDEYSQHRELQSQRLKVVAQIALDTLSTGDLTSLLGRIVGSIESMLGYDFVRIYVVDDYREYAELVAATGANENNFLEHNRKVSLSQISIVSQVVKTGGLRIVGNVDAEFIHPNDVLLPQTRSLVALPLRLESNIIGVLVIHSKLLNAFSDDDVSILKIIANQVTLAIHRSGLASQLERKLSEISLLSQRYARESWEGDLNSDRQRGYQYEIPQVSPVSRKLPVSYLPNGGIQIVDTPDDSGGSQRSTLLVPLRMHEQLIGVIGVESDRPKHMWGPSEIALIEAISSQVALALDNARLLEETQRRAEQLRLLQEITAAAASHIEVRELLSDISQRICTGYHLLYCGITLLDLESRQATIMGSSTSQDRTVPLLAGTKLRLEDSDLMLVGARTKELLVVNNLQTNPAIGALTVLGEMGVNTLIYLPVILRGEVIGMICLASKDLVWTLNEDDTRLLKQISLQTANAVDIARSFETAAHRADFEKMMIGVMTRMRETLNVELVLQTAVNEIFQAFNLEKVACYLVPHQSDQPEHGAAMPSGLSTPDEKET